MDIIIPIAERALNTYQSRAARFTAQHASKYHKYLPLIQTVYAQAYYWHGTGRYHYGHNYDSRYKKDNNGDDELLDILQSIINAGGLTPHYDPWVKVNGDYAYTISLTRCRMHARLYADTHRYQNALPEFEYGSTRFWLFLLMLLVTLAIIRHPVKSARDFVKMLASKAALESAKVWIQAIRKDYPFKILKFWQIFEAKSDIKFNYPMLFGIKKDVVKTIPVTPFMDRFESRTDQQISLAGLTHIEVPLNKIGEMENFLSMKGIRLPVIPLEFGEIFCSQYSAQSLIFNHRP